MWEKLSQRRASERLKTQTNVMINDWVTAEPTLQSETVLKAHLVVCCDSLP